MTVLPHYFIAIPIPSSLKEQIVEWQDDLKNNLPYKQWTNQEDFHITLKFLGAVESDTIKKLREALHTIEGTSSFSLELNGIETFGNPSAPRVLFVDVRLSESLKTLVDLVESSAKICGFEKEKRAFRAHITLAKKWLNQVPVESIINNYQNENQLFTVDHVHLYQIHPANNPKYEVIDSFTLKGGERDRAAH